MGAEGCESCTSEPMSTIRYGVSCARRGYSSFPICTGTNIPVHMLKYSSFILRDENGHSLAPRNHLVPWPDQLLKRPKAIRLYRFSNASVPPSITRQTASLIA